MFAKFKWLEPLSLTREFAPELENRPTHQSRLIVAAVFTLILLGLNRLGNWTGSEEVPSFEIAWWLCPIGSLLLVYFLTWINGKCSRQIRMTEKAVVVSCGNRLQFVRRWEQVTVAAIGDEFPSSYLELAGTDGSRVRVGLAANIRRDILEEWLEERPLAKDR